MRYAFLSLRIALCGLFLLLLSASASAQFRASVQGSVTDAQGGAIIGATVTLTNKETNKTQQVTTGDAGFYRFSELPPGAYTITAEQAGFTKKTLENVIVNAETTQGVNITLETGAVTANVTVTDTLGQSLETENPNLDKALTTQEVHQLPQFGRDPYELVRLTPGVFGEGARNGTGNAANLPNNNGPGGSIRSIFQVENQVQVSADGQRVTANNYQIDGTSVNSLTHGGAAVITPNQESVKEIHVISNVYSAEYGRNAGAQILTVSQNGTNQFHGSLFLKNDSPGLNAFNKFGGLNGAPTVRVNQHLNQFGGSLGGPIVIPHFGEGGRAATLAKDKAFFFFSYEGLRSNTSDVSNQYVVTPQFIAQVLAQRPGSIAARIVGSQGFAPRVITQIPVTCATAGYNATTCRQVAGGLDLGSLTGATGQYVSFGNLQGGGFDNIPDIEFAQVAVPSTNRGNQYNLRLDFNLTQKDTLAISGYRSRFFGVGSDPSTGSQPLADVTTNPANSLITITYNRILSPTMINEARFNVTRFAFNELQSSSSTNFGIPRIQIETAPSGVTNKAVQFGAPYAETTPGIFAENTFEFRDTLRKVLGNHGLSFGIELRKEQSNDEFIGFGRPLFTFETLFNFANDTPLFYFLSVNPLTGGAPNTQRYFRTHTFAAFGQDDWKFRPNLTLNLGLRYEYFSPLSEKGGNLNNFVLGPPGQELTGGRLAQMNSLYHASKLNFGPRVGFAYAPTKLLGDNLENKLVLRGGFGLLYNRVPVDVFENVRGNYPYQELIQMCCGTSAQDFSTPFNGGQILYALGANNSPLSFPANPRLILNVNPATGLPTNLQNGFSSITIYGTPPNLKTPYVYTYSLDAQYSLPAKLTAQLGYEGSTGHHLARIAQENFLYSGTVPFNIFFGATDTNSNYNAMIARLSRRLSTGFQFDVNYRWSKSIDQVSNEEVGAGTNPTFPQNMRLERGPSDYDVRHYIVGDIVYDLPFLKHRKDFLGDALGGWRISTIATYHTGFPWTPVTGNCPSSAVPIICPARPVAYFGGAGTDYSNEAFINGSNFSSRALNAQFPGLNYFSSAGATPGNGLPGVGRNSFRGPRYRDVDLTISKRFGLGRWFGEGAGLDVRANFFNVFNLLNLQPFGFNSSSTNVLDPNFGRATGALSGRVIEFQGRFSF